MGEMSTAIVTGSSRGLGLALADKLIEEGWTVVIDARGKDDLMEAASKLGTGVIAIPGDVTDEDHRLQLVQAAVGSGGLDLLVNNASILGPSPQPRLVDYPLDVLREVFEANVFAPLALARKALPLLEASRGILINITSDAAVEPYEGWGGYGSSKAALEQLSNILAAEHPDVAVYWVDPGDMNTRMHQEAFPGEDISDRPPPSVSVPGLMELVRNRPESGRYLAREVAA
jgi:NAD(P)-dependent dehydrogenase (short-subunit alcohol dehydrogenase family)